MTIKVYASIMDNEPEEVYREHGMTVDQWMRSQSKDYQRGSAQHVYCSVNGAVVDPMDWADTLIREKDNVEFRVKPKGDVFSGVLGAFFPIFSLSALAVDAAIGFLSPDIPGAGGPGEQGRSIDPANARANTARLGQAIPEGFGYYIRYPDYLNQPRRYYANTQTQVLLLMLSVGVGRYQIDPAMVKIGETPLSELDSASYQIFEPGEDVSGVINHENWFHSEEVGATQGGAGLRINGVNNSERTYQGSATGSGDNLNGIDVGSKWGVGTYGGIDLTQSITVVDGGGAGLRDTFQGNFEHLVDGLEVYIESSALSDGFYEVNSINGSGTEITLNYSGGAPVDDATPGAGQMTIDKRDTRYEITDIISGSSIEVVRTIDNGDPDPDWTGSLPQGSLSVFIDWNAGSMTANYAGPFIACPENEVADAFEFDVFAPQGLGIIDGEEVDPRTRTVLIEWREYGETTWNITGENVTGSTRSQLGWTFRVNLPSPIRPEVRIRRIGQESVATTSLDRLEVTALRARLPTVTSYADITTMAVTISNADEIARSSNNKINLETLRILPEVTEEGFTAETPTRSIAAASAYIPKTLGYGNDQLDLAEFKRLDDTWEARGDTFDYWFSDGTAKDAIDTVLRAGFAEMTIDTGVIKPVRDEPRAGLEEGYSPENMTTPLRRSFKAKAVDEPDGVEVEYTRAGTWTKETVNAFLPGDQGIKVDKITVDGVTDETRAWRIGMRRRRAQRYRRWTYNFDTELDALNSEYLSYVPLLDDIPDYGKVCILEDIQADRITVSEPLEFKDGESYVVAYRDEDGTTVGPFSANEGPDPYTVLVAIPEPWPAVLPSDMEPTHIYFGTTERWHFPALISQISPNGPLEVSVTATNYDDRVYDSDNESPQ